MDHGDTTPLLALALELEIEVLPIAGTLQHQSAPPQRFDGWLELIAAIEAELKVAREPQPPSPTAAA